MKSRRAAQVSPSVSCPYMVTPFERSVRKGLVGCPPDVCSEEEHAYGGGETDERLREEVELHVCSFRAMSEEGGAYPLHPSKRGWSAASSLICC